MHNRSFSVSLGLNLESIYAHKYKVGIDYIQKANNFEMIFTLWYMYFRIKCLLTNFNVLGLDKAKVFLVILLNRLDAFAVLSEWVTRVPDLRFLVSGPSFFLLETLVVAAFCYHVWCYFGHCTAIIYYPKAQMNNNYKLK